MGAKLSADAARHRTERGAMILAAPMGRFRGVLSSVVRFAPWALLGALSLSLLASLVGLPIAIYRDWDWGILQGLGDALAFALLAFMSGVVLFLLMLLWPPKAPIKKADPIVLAAGVRRAAVAAFYVAPWAWLGTFGATLAVIAADHEKSNAWWVYGPALINLCVESLLLISPLAVGADLIWRLVRRVSVQGLAPAIAAYMVGLALTVAVVFGNVFGLMDPYRAWLD